MTMLLGSGMTVAVTVAATPNETVGWATEPELGRTGAKEIWFVSVYPVETGATPVEVLALKEPFELVAVSVRGLVAVELNMLNDVAEPPLAWVKVPEVELTKVPDGPVGAVKPPSVAVIDRTVSPDVVPAGMKIWPLRLNAPPTSVWPGKSLVAPRLLNWKTEPAAVSNGFKTLTSMPTDELEAPGSSNGVVTIVDELVVTVIVMTSACAWPAKRPIKALNAKTKNFP